MKRLRIYKHFALAILLIAAMVATAGCGPGGIAFALDQLNNLDEQEVETPEADDTDEADDDDQGEDEDAVEGVIESISGNTIVVDGQTFTVSDYLLDELALLSPGMEIEVEFFIDASGNMIITEIELEDEAEDLDDNEDQGADEDDQGEDEGDDDDDQGEDDDDQGEDDDD